MPNTRRKACQQCRVAKARCSLASPCSRCAERRLQCHYHSSNFRPRINLRPSTQNAEPGVLYRPSHNPSQGASPGDFLRPMELIDWNDLQGNNRLLDTFQASLDNTNITPSLHGNREYPNVPILWDSNIPNSLSTCMATLNPNDPSNEINSVTISRSNTSASVLEAISPLETSRPTRETHKSRNNPPRRPAIVSTAAKTLTYQVLRGQIKSYPKMMIDGVILPHFIHSRCVLRDQSIQDCVSDAGIHCCLPEPLAICASLMQMFFSKTDASSVFVQSKIHEEISRLHREVSFSGSWSPPFQSCLDTEMW